MTTFNELNKEYHEYQNEIVPVVWVDQSGVITQSGKMPRWMIDAQPVGTLTVREGTEEHVTPELTPVQQRAKDYPPLTDQIDAIFKGFLALQTAGVELPKETTDWIKQVLQVKQDNPITSEPS